MRGARIIAKFVAPTVPPARRVCSKFFRSTATVEIAIWAGAAGDADGAESAW